MYRPVDVIKIIDPRFFFLSGTLNSQQYFLNLRIDDRDIYIFLAENRAKNMGMAHSFSIRLRVKAYRCESDKYFFVRGVTS